MCAAAGGADALWQPLTDLLNVASAEARRAADDAPRGLAAAAATAVAAGKSIATTEQEEQLKEHLRYSRHMRVDGVAGLFAATGDDKITGLNLHSAYVSPGVLSSAAMKKATGKTAAQFKVRSRVLALTLVRLQNEAHSYVHCCVRAQQALREALQNVGITPWQHVGQVCSAIAPLLSSAPQ